MFIVLSQRLWKGVINVERQGQAIFWTSIHTSGFCLDIHTLLASLDCVPLRRPCWRGVSKLLLSWIFSRFDSFVFNLLRPDCTLQANALLDPSLPSKGQKSQEIAAMTLIQCIQREDIWCTSPVPTSKILQNPMNFSSQDILLTWPTFFSIVDNYLLSQLAPITKKHWGYIFTLTSSHTIPCPKLLLTCQIIAHHWLCPQAVPNLPARPKWSCHDPRPVQAWRSILLQEKY